MQNMKKTFGLLLAVACFVGGEIETTGDEKYVVLLEYPDETVEYEVEKEIGHLPNGSPFTSWQLEGFDFSGDEELTGIVFPKKLDEIMNDSLSKRGFVFGNIDVVEVNLRNCVNLTNLVIEFKKATFVADITGSGLKSVTYASNGALYNPALWIESPISPIHGTTLYPGSEGIRWTRIEDIKNKPKPKLTIRTIQGSDGLEVEVVWTDGTLQLSADIANPIWINTSSMKRARFPVKTSKPVHFFRLKPQE